MNYRTDALYLPAQTISCTIAKYLYSPISIRFYATLKGSLRPHRRDLT